MIPGPQAMVSRWPVAPHWQGTPAASEQLTWPMWPASLWAPSMMEPRSTKAPPMPVPTATTRQLEASRPAPQRASPRAWACTSFRTRAGRPVAEVSSAPRWVPPQPGIMSFA